MQTIAEMQALLAEMLRIHSVVDVTQALADACQTVAAETEEEDNRHYLTLGHSYLTETAGNLYAS